MLKFYLRARFLPWISVMYIPTVQRTTLKGLPWWLRGWRICLRCKRAGFDPWAGKIPWRRKWQPTPAFVPGESHGQRSLAGYGPWGLKESNTCISLLCSRQLYLDVNRRLRLTMYKTELLILPDPYHLKPISFRLSPIPGNSNFILPTVYPNPGVILNSLSPCI